MAVQQSTLLTLMLVLGGLMVLGGGGFLIFRVLNQRRMYRALRPEESPTEEGPSAQVVFIILSFFALAIGLLLLGLGIFGTVAPEEAGLLHWRLT